MQLVREGSKKVRKGDKVRVMSGNAKGQVGTVAVRLGDRVVIEGVNLCKKHVKRSQRHPEGGRVDVERPIHVSNVRPCDETGQPVRLRVRKNAEGSRDLTFSKEGQQVTWRSIKGSKK